MCFQLLLSENTTLVHYREQLAKLYVRTPSHSHNYKVLLIIRKEKNNNESRTVLSIQYKQFIERAVWARVMVMSCSVISKMDTGC